MLTAELRWFFDGAPAPELLTAFRVMGADSETRTDSYLRFAAAASVGIKLRQGRLEAKARVHAVEVSLSDSSVRGISVHGVEEWWEKQSVSDEAEYALLEGVWLAVYKNRLLLSPAVHRVGPAGVSAEVTRLVVEDRAFWTLGFEVVGPPPASSDRLRQAARDLLPQLLRYAEMESLDVGSSMSYPQWLLTLNGA